MQDITVKETADFLKEQGNPWILIHRSPDGDCIGAGYGLALILEALGKKTKVLCADEAPEIYKFMIPQSYKETDFTPDYYISVDVADPKLFGDELKEQYGDKITLNIDHHISNIGYSEYRLLDGSASSACEMVYRLTKELGIAIHEELAICLYTGILTDTGCLIYDCTGPNTLRAVADIMEQCPNIPYAIINRNLFIVKTMDRLKLNALLTEMLEPIFDGKGMILCMNNAFIKGCGVPSEELDGTAGFPLQIKGVEFSITMKEKEPGEFRISMRSADWVNVSAICQRLGGGGHVKAAGCMVKGTEDEARAKIMQAVTEEWSLQCSQQN